MVDYKDTQTVRDAKLYIGMLSLQNDVNKLVALKPPYSISPELKVRPHEFSLPRCHRHLSVFQINIQAYVPPVLLSEHIGGYKGDVPSQYIFVRLLTVDPT